MVKVSLFASAVRPKLWESMFKSLEKNEVEFEVVFAGPLTLDEIEESYTGEMLPYWFKYITTGNIKPSQCYEVARRACRGGLVNWTADDCEYEPGLLDDIHEFWNSLNDWKIIVSVATNENNSFNNLNDHRFFGWNVNTPQMAPLGFMSRTWLEELGGLDRRYVCGQYENDIVMRSNQFGGKVIKYFDKCVNIEHLKKHGPKSDFWSGWGHDREVLENSWVVGGSKPYPDIALDIKKKEAFYPIVADREVMREQIDKFEPFEDEDILTKSQSFKGEWE